MSINNRTSPFKSLKHVAIAPPTALYNKILHRLQAEDAAIDEAITNTLQLPNPMACAPISAQAMLQKIKAANAVSPFVSLKNYEVAPPISFAAILLLLRPKVGKITIGAFAKVMMAAAAAIIILIVVYPLYQKKQTTSLTQTTNKKEPMLPILAEADTNTPTNTNLQAHHNKPSQSKIKAATASTQAAIPYAPVANYYTMPDTLAKFTIGGNNIALVNNDYLATFASFNEANAPLFLKETSPTNTTIVIDKYSSITVSPTMGAMMKKMYSTRKSGKPTRRAKKTFEKIEKWKLGDAKYFDSTNRNNPLDPFDLGNFIFHK